MQDFETLDFKVHACTSEKGEQRLELRRVSDGSFVAWFRSHTRMSDSAEVTSITTEFVRRKELTLEQTAAVETWLREHTLASL